jgi:hypothetical protein
LYRFFTSEIAISFLRASVTIPSSLVLRSTL